MALGKIDGSAESWKRLKEFLTSDAEREIEAYFSCTRPQAVRVLAVRHGMASHNTFAGIGSIVSEDAELNQCGRTQADMVGNYLWRAGVAASLDMVVVSPFTRTLQTACRLLGAEHGVWCEPNAVATVAGASSGESSGRGRTAEAGAGRARGPRRTPATVVQPLCAEQTFAISHLGRGNRGSTAAELRRRPEFAGFDLEGLERYCVERRVASKDGERAGKWWHHGPHSQETEGSFQRRCVCLRKWLGGIATEGSTKLLLVSHGGVMEEAFGFPNPPNCGFRVLDVFAGGAALRVSTGEWVQGASGLLADPAFDVFSVLRHRRKTDGHNLFDIELSVGAENFIHVARESELREALHDVVREGLAAELYERFRLSGKFPSRARLQREIADPSIHIQDYLEQLAAALGDEAFPRDLAGRVDAYLLRGRLGLAASAGAAADLPRASRRNRSASASRSGTRTEQEASAAPRPSSGLRGFARRRATSAA